MGKLTVIRKRLIPFEEVDISGDEQLCYDGAVLVTRWLPIKPRADMGWGQSVTDIRKGLKVSAIFDSEGRFSHWYWDIVNVTRIDCAGDSDRSDCSAAEGDRSAAGGEKLIVEDQLLDVVVYKDLSCEILDEDELEEALSLGLMTEDGVRSAKERVKEVLALVESGHFPLQEAAEGRLTPPAGFIAKTHTDLHSTERET